MKILTTLLLFLPLLFCSAADPTPFAAWSMDELSGAVAKDKYGSYDGIITEKCMRVAGKSGQALRFGDERSFVYAKLPWKNSSFSFSAWTKVIAFPDKTQASICGFPGWSTDIGVTASGNFYFELFNKDKQQFMAVSPDSYPLGQWHYVSGVFDLENSKLMLYIDGEKLAEKAFAGSLFPYPDDFYIGCSKPTSFVVPYWYKGDIDEVEVYRTKISGDFIKKRYLELKNKEVPADKTVSHVGKHGQPLWLTPPSETVQALTDEFKKILSKQSKSNAEREQDSRGVPVLEINGKITPFLGVDLFERRLEAIYLQPFTTAGMKIVNVSVNIGRPYEFSGMKPYWNGPDSYDFSDIEKHILRPLQTDPSCKIILWVQIDPYWSWHETHPDDLMRNERGDGMVAEQHFQRYGIPANKRERLVWSFFSDKFRDEMSETLKRLIADIEKSPAGNSVVGYLIGGGTDAQLYHWQPPNHILSKPENWGDYSKPALKAWRVWLKDKYEYTSEISKAWNMSVTDFDKLSAPSASALCGGSFFHDPAKERQAMDWKRFITDGRRKLISHFAGLIKNNVSGDKIVGICSGDSGSRRDLTSMEEFLRDDNIDFFLHQATYGQRLPPNIGGINANLASIAVNEKLFVADSDQPTWCSKPHGNINAGAGIHHDASFHGWAKDIESLRSMWRRDFGMLWTTGAGALWNPVFGDLWAYSDQSIIDELKFIVETSAKVKAQSPEKPLAELAVIYDEKAVDYLKGGLSQAHSQWIRMQQNELYASGVPFGVYYLADLKEGLVPPSKLYILQNLMNLDRATCKALERLKKNGATLLFMNDTGYEQSFTDINTVFKATGIHLERADRADNVNLPLNMKSSLTNWNTDVKTAKSGIKWPTEATIYGPFPKNAPEPDYLSMATAPSLLKCGNFQAASRKIAINPSGTDIAAALSIRPEEGLTAYILINFESSKAGEFPFGASADWWMKWCLNGKTVYDTYSSGNGKAGFNLDTHRFTASVNEGRNTVIIKVSSGTNGFALAAGGPDEIAAPPSFNCKSEKIELSEYSLCSVDPEAEALAYYPGTSKTAFAFKNCGSWKSVFIGSRVISRDMISKLAEESGAWRLSEPNIVSGAAENIIMLHPLKDGIYKVRLKKEAALESLPPDDIKTSSKLEHELNLKAGHTYLFKY